MSRWSKRSQEEKERIFKEQQEQRNRNPLPKQIPFPFYMLKPACEEARRKAGHKVMCRACDLRCPGCPFESVWPEKKSG